jgi:hypothetical protein
MPATIARWSPVVLVLGGAGLLGCAAEEQPVDGAADADPSAGSSGSETAAEPGDDATGGGPASTAAASTSTGDTGSDDGTSSGGAAPEGIPIFVAQGMVGRTTISCDDGLTWVADRAWDVEGDPHLCGSDTPVTCDAEGSTCSQVWFDGTCSMEPCDCGHSPRFSKGVVYGAGRFVATWGWGWPGAIAASTNGVDWTTALDNDTFGGLRFGGDRFVAASRTPQVSLDGLTWTPSAEANFEGADGVTIWSVRRFGFADVDGGRFVAYASGDSSTDTLVSSDGGDTWWRPSSIPADCLGEGPGAYGDILGGNGVIVMVDGDGHSCRSTDGGDTWTSSQVTDQRIASSGVWTGEEFWFWGWGNRYRSADGVAWTTEPIVADADVGPVARSPDGTLVAVNNVWLGYDAQVFLRSTDGLTWDTLPAGSFAPSHPIFFITHGFAEASDACPGA